MSRKICVQGERGQPPFYLHASGFWRSSGPEEVEDRGQSPQHRSLHLSLVVAGSSVPDGDGGHCTIIVFGRLDFFSSDADVRVCDGAQETERLGRQGWGLPEECCTEFTRRSMNKK